MRSGDPRSSEARQWRKLYRTAGWQRLRDSVLREQPLCIMCLRMDVVEPATVVDHIRPHKGNEVLFWDVDNLQSLCKPCHDMHKQREERGEVRVAYGVDGYPL